ncbi:SLC13 family permease [Peptococcus simiae]|uniref:SLC13 family permease n=1 Tax=Peptococcus simiae TaxID=1643805 RepID=A0ABW9H0I2_9FIRM
MSTQESVNREWLKALVVLGIAALGWIIPAPAPMTPIGMRCLAVFLAMIAGWSMTSGAWPSFLGLLLFPLTGVMPLKEFVGMGWGTDVMLFLVLSFAMISYLEETGVSRFMASWLMTRSFLQGHPWRLIFMILFAAYWICSLVNTFIGMFLMWQIVYSITESIGQKPYDKFPTLMVFGIAMFGALSLTAMPWGGNAIVNLSVYANIAGETANMLEYIAFTLPYGMICIALYLVMAKFLFRLDVRPLMNISKDNIDHSALEMNPEKKIALISLLVFVVMLLGPGLLPKGTPAFEFYQRFGIAGVMLLFMTGMLLITHKRKDIFSFPKLATKGVPWPMIMMVSVILAIGGTLMHESTGIAPYLNQTLVPMLSNLSPIAFVCILIAIVVVLTNFMINMVVVAMFLPVVIPMAESMGYSPMLLSFAVMVASTNAILTPAGCAASSILFPNKEWITAKDIYKYGTPTVIIFSIVLIGYFFVGSLFLG